MSYLELPYRATHVANFILENAERDKVSDLTVLKLLKLIYIFFGWVSAIHPRTKLFSDPIEAWRYGPVVPDVYYDLRRSSQDPIPKQIRATIMNYSGDGSLEVKIPTKEDISDEKIFQTLETIWDVYKDAPAKHLVALTHQEGTPWWKTFDRTHHKRIPTELIINYYAELYSSID